MQIPRFENARNVSSKISSKGVAARFVAVTRVFPDFERHSAQKQKQKWREKIAEFHTL
jgi:hypothetical protein